jgi:predicted TIM-barrel fold metal-dependent hydrolase
MTITDTGLTYIDSDGHILEPPTALPEYAAAKYRDRIWHIETDKDGEEWLCFDGDRTPANILSVGGLAGMSEEDVERGRTGQMRYSQCRPAAWDAKLRLLDMDADGIDFAVLYPTSMLAIQGHRDEDFALAQCQAYNNWISDHTTEGEGRLFGAAALPPMNDADGVQRVATEIRRVAKLPGIVSTFLRPNPSVDWRPFDDAAYDPVWAAAADTGLALGFHPYLVPDLPGASLGMKMMRAKDADWNYEPLDQMQEGQVFTNVALVQSMANTFDVMAVICHLTAAGVCEKFPAVRFILLEANGGWIVPWLERLDHQTKKYPWDVPWLTKSPSEHFRSQCWISFDPDEAMLAISANSPLVGADRIIWASDYPHPDAKFPGVTEELNEAIGTLTHEQKRQITSESAKALYGIG